MPEGSKADTQTIRSNIVLIGMPGCGKSSTGIILAKQLLLEFVDTDVLIQTREHCSLQHIVDTEGHQRLLCIEEEVVLDFKASEHVIATGGSVVYSDPAMQHLSRYGRIVYLQVKFDDLKKRLGDFSVRGIAKRTDQTLEELFTERTALYEQYAEVSIDCTGLNQDEVCQAVIALINA